MSARAPGADKNRNRKERLNEMKADYHVHYYIDSCAADEMTFPNIEKKALELGLDEISVLKHHSRRMPNGEAAWVCWKRVKPEEWQRYLDEYAAYRPEKLVIHSGVESELCSEDGEIDQSVKNSISPRYTLPPATCLRGRQPSFVSASCLKNCFYFCSAGFTRGWKSCKENPMDIAVENLSVSFGEKQVLRTLSLTFPAGSCTAVMGPSGSGKTTLLRVLMGLEKAYEGKVSGIPEKRSAVFQEDRLQDFYSALANLRLTLPGIKNETLLHELSLLGLTGPDARKPARSLSGGMKRRVALARAMLADGEVLFLDEPFKGLDEKTRTQAIEFVRTHRNGRTLIAVTHDEREAEALGCTILRLEFTDSAALA